MMSDKMSTYLPFKAGLPPAVRYTDLAMTPPFLNCCMSLGNLMNIHPYFLSNNAIDGRSVIRYFKSLNLAQ